MVDYGSYMRNNSSNDQFTNKLLNVMQFKQNKRKNQMSMDLMRSRKAQEANEETYETGKRKSEAVIRMIQAEKLQPGAGKTIGQFEGIKDVEFSAIGDDMSFTGPKGRKISGPPDNIQKLSELMIQGNLEAAEQYRQNPLNRISTEQPENLQGAYTNAFNVGNESEMNKATTAMQAAARANRDSRTPQMINAEALTGGGEGESFTKELRGLLEKQGGADRAQKAYVSPEGKVEYFANNVKPPNGYTPYSTGMEITTADGTTVRTGVNTSGTGKATTNEIEGTVLEAREAVNGIANIISGYKPKYQTFPFRAKAAYESIRQKMGGKPDPEMKDQLVDFGSWYKIAMRDYAIAIQKLGKGNLTKNEEKLYGAGLPDPGKGIFPKDAPEVYWNALVDRYKGLNATVARHQHYLNSGLKSEQYYNLVRKDQVISVDQMNEVINARGKELEEEFKNSDQGMGADEIFKAIKSALASEFGIGG